MNDLFIDLEQMNCIRKLQNDEETLSYREHAYTHPYVHALLCKSTQVQSIAVFLSLSLSQMHHVISFFFLRRDTQCISFSPSILGRSILAQMNPCDI